MLKAKRAKLVIGTEIDPAKAAAARAGLEQAGLERFAEVRMATSGKLFGN